jgi:hypothetical protein
MNRKRLLAKLKTLPGAAMATLATAAVGAFVAYFAPRVFDRITGEDRPTISLQTNPETIDTFSDLPQWLVVPRGQQASGTPGPGCMGFHSWGADVGAVQAAESRFRVIVQGGGDQVLISGIRARVLERKPPLAGTGFVCQPQAEAKIRYVRIDLDDPDPTGRVIEGVPLDRQLEERPVAFTVAENETEVFDITASTDRCYCRWILELITTQGGDEEVITVPEDETPFETTALPGDRSAFGFSTDRPHYSWNYTDSWATGTPRNYDELPASDEPLPPLPTIQPPRPSE